MKTIKYILGAAFIAVGLTSCTLDAVNYTEKSTENYPKTGADAQQALAGVYQNLNKVNATPQCSFLYAAQLASDDCLGGGGDNDQMMQCYDLLCNTGTDMTYQFYKDRYEGINRANAVLDALQTISVTDSASKNQWVGEAKFLRAYYYYELASFYNRIRVVTSSTPSDSISQGTPSQVWGQILMDLRDASRDMPSVRHTDGHVDKYCAEAMLARAFLFYTGMFCNGETIADMTSTTYKPLTEVALPDGSTLTKQQVIGYIDDCVDNSGYSLVSDYRNLWAYTNRCTREDYSYTKGQGLSWAEDDNAVNPESMFAIHYNKRASWSTTIGYSNGYALHFGVRGQVTDGTVCFPFGSGWGAGPISPNLKADWDAEETQEGGKDIRRDATIAVLSDDPGYKWGGDNNVQETALHGKKLSPIMAIDHDGVAKDDGSTKGQAVPCFEEIMYGNDGGESGGYGSNLQLDNIHDLVLIRFADVLLMQSELKEDATGLNRVRARAGLAPVSYSLKAVQDERRWELAGEGIRWNDIRRWHIAADCLAKQQETDIHWDGATTKNYRQKGGYVARYNATAGFFKIPESAIDLSYGGLTQNEGWTGNDSQYSGWVNSDN